MKIDMHLHSIYSGDSNATPKDILKKAESVGLDGLTFMDHNTLEGYRKIKDTDTPLIVVPGIEVSTEEGHVMAIGVQEEIGKQATIAEAIDKIEEQGGIAAAPHPYRYWSGMGEENLFANKWTAIEGLNGRSWHSKNLKARKAAEKLELPIIGGSDAHRLKTVGKAYTVFDPLDSWEDVLCQIKKGNVDAAGEDRTFVQTFFYIRRAIFGYVGRGFKKI
ncbi:MAG: CehA/McbA family metallohydrolase [Candidatus Saliniplasma sp.]